MKTSVQEALDFIRKKENLKTKLQAERFVMNKYRGFLFEAVISYFLELSKGEK